MTRPQSQLLDQTAQDSSMMKSSSASFMKKKQDISYMDMSREMSQIFLNPSPPPVKKTARGQPIEMPK
jgi:hypothetical protein